MTPRIKERFLNAIISALTAGGAVVLAFALSSGETQNLNIQKELRQKAPYEYVDKQDNAIKENFNEYKEAHVIQHDFEYHAIQSQLELIIELVKED